MHAIDIMYMFIHAANPMCPPLEDIDNGSVDFADLQPGTIATYTCIPGFLLSGTSTRTCQEDGRWSGEEPTCERKNQNMIVGVYT